MYLATTKEQRDFAEADPTHGVVSWEEGRGAGKSVGILLRARTRGMMFGANYSALIVAFDRSSIDRLAQEAQHAWIGCGQWHGHYQFEFKGGGMALFRVVGNSIKDAANMAGHLYNELLVDDLHRWTNSRPIEMLRTGIRSFGAVPPCFSWTYMPSKFSSTHNSVSRSHESIEKVVRSVALKHGVQWTVFNSVNQDTIVLEFGRNGKRVCDFDISGLDLRMGDFDQIFDNMDDYLSSCLETSA